MTLARPETQSRAFPFEGGAVGREPDCNIYALFSTRDATLRYIGQTSDHPSYRRDEHVKAARRGKKTALAEWIRSEVAAGAQIRVKALDWHGVWGVSEREYIALYRAMGAPLLNVHPGGGGRPQEKIGRAHV